MRGRNTGSRVVEQRIYPVKPLRNPVKRRSHLRFIRYITWNRECCILPLSHFFQRLRPPADQTDVPTGRQKRLRRRFANSATCTCYYNRLGHMKFALCLSELHSVLAQAGRFV